LVERAPPAPFQAARQLLFRQDHEALSFLRQLVSDGTISAAQLASSPFFDRIREAGLLGGLLGEQSS
jgi:hypothetical protein